jgi:serine/threonine protein kinase
MPTPPEEIAGRYRVLEEAGRGGMGAVYRCIDERLGREVAVKQVGRMPGESVTDQARALREARSSAALNHPNVVSVYDAMAEGDHVWLVMEYVAGRTLSQMVREDGPLSPHRAAWIGAQVADGLAAAHQRGTTHRDVKPGNVLVTEGDRAKISDFGIARTTGDASLTQSGILTGTPGYFAPEIARGGDPGPASDVWALGATLYHAVEGRPPYGENPNALQLLAKVAAEDPPAPERAGVLAGPISRMLDRDPASRWSMADAAHALHRIHEQTPEAGAQERTRAFAAAPAAVSPSPAGPAAASSPASAPAPGPTAAPETRSRRRRPAGVAALVAALVAVVVIAAVALTQLGDDPAKTPAADDETPSDTSEPTTQEDQTPENSPGPTESAPTESSPTETESDEDEETQPGPGGGRDPATFVEDYYAVLPGDTEAGYSMLSPSYQERLSYGEYDGFWSGIGEVTVQDSAPAGGGAVDVTLLYDGGSEEVRRVYLERGPDGWLISGDEILG